MTDKEIRFTQKKVDESWKEQTTREKEAKARGSEAPPQVSSPLVVNFLSSLGLQILIHLGEVANPETNQRQVNLDAAKEIIDLLVDLKKKMQGNTGPEESDFFNSFLPELQMKFSQNV